MTKRFFTPAEVDALIPDLESIVRQLKSLESEIQEKVWRLKRSVVEAKQQDGGPDDLGLAKAEAEVEFLQILAKGQFDRVRELGGDVKMGFLVDFPAVIYGQEVLLCWKPGERQIRWYHAHDEGFAGRKLIPTEMLGEPAEEE